MDQPDRDYDFQPEYGGLTSHLPMTVRALSNLGADEARVAEFRAAYSPRLSALAESANTGSVDIGAALGQRLEFPALLGWFSRETAALGKHGVVRKWLPTLMPGVAAAAFHPLIMLYYALDAQSERGVAYALAYFAWSYLSLGSFGPPGSLGLGSAVSRLTGVGRTKDATGLLYDRLLLEARRPAVKAVVSELRPETEEQSALTLVISTHHLVNDLLSLHMVTSWHAHRRIAEIVGVEDAEMRLHLLRALLIAYVACDAPKLERLPSSKHSWQEVIEIARRDPDEHVIKLVWTCLDIQQRWQIETLALAARAAKLNSTG